MELKRNKVIAELNSALVELNGIRSQLDNLPLDDRVPDGIRQEVNTFREKWREFLAENGLETEAEEFARVAFQKKGINVQELINVLDALKSRINSIRKKSSGEKVTESRKGKKVFIVHGHDTANLKRLKKVLKNTFGLDPVVLGERPGGVKPLIKKFEDEAKQVVFAFVLMTPDDLIGGRKYAQARPNVFFELGWFFGWFLCKTSDPDKRGVCILYQTRGKKVPPKINTDLDGVSRIEFEHSIENKETTDAIGRELRAAGLIK